jgi:hypothetical protein
MKTGRLHRFLFVGAFLGAASFFSVELSRTGSLSVECGADGSFLGLIAAAFVFFVWRFAACMCAVIHATDAGTAIAHGVTHLFFIIILASALWHFAQGACVHLKRVPSRQDSSVRAQIPAVRQTADG